MGIPGMWSGLMSIQAVSRSKPCTQAPNGAMISFTELHNGQTSSRTTSTTTDASRAPAWHAEADVGQALYHSNGPKPTTSGVS